MDTHPILKSIDTPLKKLTKSTKKHHRYFSTIDRVIQSSKTKSIPYLPIKNNKCKTFTMDSIIKATNAILSKYNKNTTPPTIFHQLFRTLKSSYPNHNFVYTDASKSGGITTYSITTETVTIKLGQLPFYSSVLSSEIIAIQEAINICVKIPGKHVICTDSLSSISSITNNNNHSHYATSVRNLVTNHFPKISLVWVPSHIGLVGNENADEAAKLASKFPLTLTANNNSNDFTHFLKKSYKTNKQTFLVQHLTGINKLPNQKQKATNNNKQTQTRTHKLNQCPLPGHG